MIDLPDLPGLDLGGFVVKPAPPPPSGEQILANVREAAEKLTTCVVVHPDDADTVRAAARRIPPPSIVEVTESPLVDRGTAIAFPRGGGPLREVPLPPPAGSTGDAAGCRCADRSIECPEGWSAGLDPATSCVYCTRLDPYAPCPVLGFGCGSTPGSECDCCTPEQRKAAAL